MRKNILPILLLLSMYMYFFIIIIYRKVSGPMIDRLPMVGLIYCCFVVLIFIPNMVYAFLLVKKGARSSLILFWDMMLKLFQIPIYAMILLAGVGLSLSGIGIILIPFFLAFDYLLLLATSMYGVSGLIQARREGKITLKAAIINGILHFLFCADVISAFIIFIKVKRTDKKLLDELNS